MQVKEDKMICLPIKIGIHMSNERLRRSKLCILLKNYFVPLIGEGRKILK